MVSPAAAVVWGTATSEDHHGGQLAAKPSQVAGYACRVTPNSRLATSQSNHVWRDRDVVWVVVCYCALLLGFFLLESLFVGTATLDGMPSNAMLFLIEELGDAALLFLLPIFLVLGRYRATLAEMGFVGERPFVNTAAGAITGATLWALSLLWSWVCQSFGHVVSTHPYIEQLEGADSVSQWTVIGASLVLLTPIAEETFFRGFVYTTLAKNHGKTSALLVSATLFAVFHFNLTTFLVVWISGAVFAILLSKTRSLVPAVVGHAVFNGLSVAVTF